MKRNLLFSVVFFAVASLFFGNTAFAARRVTNVTYGNQTGTASAGTATSVTYTISLSETGSSGPFSDNIQLAWTSGTPTGVTWAFTSSTEGVSGGTTLNPTFTPSGNNSTITFTVTTTGSTPAGSYGFTIKITDNNSGGGPYNSGAKTFVVGGPPTISYTGSPYTYYTAQAITSLTPVVTGSPTGYSISPSLPSGLSFNSGTGVISGTPSAAASSATYTITATNGSGSGNTTINITVLPSTISYTGSPYTFYRGTAISTLSSTEVGGNPTSYAVSPALPAGLSLNTTTGDITGTPTAASGSATYTITGNYGSGITATTTINITVLNPTISYTGSPYTYLTGVAISSLTPTVTGTPSSYSISPGLPTGLAFSTTTGVVSGTPTSASAATSYTVTANYAGGVTATTTINITINLSPPNISYTPTTNTYTTGVAISTWSATNTGGVSTTWSISPGLPAGLSFNTSNGDITGTPTAISALTTYTITATNSGGSSNTTITIKVNPPPPVISYTPSTNYYTGGTAIPALNPVNSGGTATSWSISPGLPLGLSFNTSTGVISGTPILLSGTTTYTITANNVGGSGSTTVILRVDLLGISFGYTPATNTYIVGTAISTWSPTVLTGSPTSYAISPGLPAGLSFNTSTGAITGTPTAATASATYTVTASNANSSANTTITILVNSAAPVISYTPSTNVYTVGTAISTLTPVNTGGPVVSYAISPGLSAGLSFNTSTGVISGTPTAVKTATTYTITATNAGGSGSTTVNLTVNPVAPNITYTPVSNTYVIGTGISSWSPVNTGGPVTSYSIGPALPAGLTINTTTGVISGTPSATDTATFTVTAINAGGSSNFDINITVLPKPPNIKYTPSSVTYTVGSAISPAIPSNSGGPADTYSIGPALPDGLTFDPSTGIISGTPTAVSAQTTYVISADNDNGSSTTSLKITIKNPAVPKIKYTPATKTETVGTAIATWTPASTGGAVDSWSIDIALPAGLSFDTTTGVISGTPTATSPTTVYTVTATNAGGTDVATVTLTVNAPAPIISYTPSTNTYSVGATITSLTPVNTGGVATSWAITGGGSLPAGLSFNTSTGVISGTPTAVAATKTYTITATNATGSGSTTVTMTVNNTGPNITYVPGTVSYSVGTTITAATPTNTGGAASTWAITAGGSLPSGLTLNASTGVISGTPTTVFPTTTFTIKATNASGNSSTNLIITVSPHAPVISYTPSTNVYRLNATIPNLDPINTGGAVTGYSYSSTGVSLTGASLSGPSLMTIDASGNIYVANYNNKTISKYNSSNVYVGTYTTGKTFTNPEGIVFDSAGNCYVEDTGAGAIYKFGPTGAYISTIISGLNHPLGISIDPSDNLYIATYVYTSPYTSSVTKYSTGGTLLQTISNTNMDQSDGVAVDGSGNIYVLNRAQDQAGTNKGYVTKYNSTGTYLGVFSSGYEDPLAISCDPSGNVFVADSHNNQVKIYSSNGVLLNTISGFNDVEGFVADGNGNLYVSDFSNNTVKEFAANGGYRISSPLPAGLSFDTSTGRISGTPTVTFPATTYTVTAYNITGNGTTTVTLSCLQSNDWIGVTSTDWNTASNWRSNIVPTSAQSALIGVNESFNYFPTVLTGAGTVNVGSIQLGNVGGKSPGVIVTGPSTLNVIGDITYQSDASSALAYTALLSGTGTINAANINVISNTTLGSSYTSTFASSIFDLNVSGNLALTTSNSGAAIFNSTFNLTGGTTSLGGVQTTNTASSTSSLIIIPGSTATLQLASTNPLSGLSATGTNVVTFKNTGATVEYSGAAQTVYTTSAITGLPAGVSYQNITFSGTGLKTVGTGNLNIAGDFDNNMANDASNTVKLNSPTVNFNGTTQGLDGGSGTGTIFYNVTFSGLGTKTMTGGQFTVASTGVLSMLGSSTSTILASNGRLTLNSLATSSATIAAIPTGPSITGDVNVQRYVTGGTGYRSYRLASSPVYAGTVSSNNVYSLNYLQNSIYLTGNAGGGFDKTGNPTLYVYREDITPSNVTFISGNFLGISAINNTPAYSYYMNGGSTGYNLPVGNGFLFFFRGNRASASLATETTVTYTNPVAVVMTTTGTLNQGQVTVHDWYSPGSQYLGYTGSGTGTNYTVRGFNLVGNPYAASIDWELSNSTTTTSGIYANNIGSTIYELNPATSNYDTYQKGGVYTNHGKRTIVSGQGFFVLAVNSTNPQLIFNESAKSTTQNTGLNLFMSTSDDLAALSTTTVDPHLRLQMALDSVNTDDTYIGFNASDATKYVTDEDAPYKLGNGKVSLASYSNDNILLAINKMPLPKVKKTVVPLYVGARANGIYSLNMTELAGIPPIYQVWLIDHYTKDSLDMRYNKSYSFNITADTNSFGSKRFELGIREDQSLAVRLLNFNAVKVTSGAQVSWVTENEQNYTNFTVERSTDGGKTFSSLGIVASSGLGSYSYLDPSPVAGTDAYRLKLVDLNGTVSYSNVVTLTYGTTSTSAIAQNNISLYPNPAGSTINLTINPASGTTDVLSQKTLSGISSIKSPTNAVYSIKIVSATGMVVKTSTTSTKDWQANVSNLLPGTYIMQVYNNSDNSIVGKGTFIKL